MIHVICAKWGSKYDARYVNRLYAGVLRWLDRDFRFLCFTDDAQGIDPRVEVHDLPDEDFDSAFVHGDNRPGRKGAWRKISLFKPGLAGMDGPVLGFDLDVVITGPLAPIIDFDPKGVVFRREWRYERLGKDGGHGSVFTFDPQLHPYIYEEFAADPVRMIETHKGSEQYYTSMTALRHGNLSYMPGNLVQSFKRNVLPSFPLNLIRTPRLPRDCSVMCFHGDPKMEDVLQGTSKSLRHFSKRCLWLETMWVDPPAPE